MRILLDTHIFLWFISGDTQLSICQPLQNGLTIATVDTAVRAYSVSVM
jgi:PIN domain nuclease of toxin-antitoxin system